ncbi:MAG: hypothetical protein ICV74_00810 [Thermoleophilia bacterium]|nr:hypothetical protein [Thermoleophilia bacterium]
MELHLFLLLLGFTLAKMALAATIVWVGVRSPERPEEDDGPDGGSGGPGGQPLPPRRPRAYERGGPERTPSRGRSPRRRRTTA